MHRVHTSSYAYPYAIANTDKYIYTNGHCNAYSYSNFDIGPIANVGAWITYTNSRPCHTSRSYTHTYADTYIDSYSGPDPKSHPTNGGY